MCGKGSNTTTQTTGPAPQAMAAYNQVLQQAGTAAAAPYVPYSGQEVAPVNGQQQTGISGINAAAGQAQPGITAGFGQIQGSTQPLTAAQIQQYESPYTQHVIDATQAQFNNQNQQQQSQVVGNAAAQGALGGDRVGVAQALTAQQQQLAQAPVIAGLENTGYNQAVQTAENQQRTGLAGGQAMVGAATAGQNAGLQGANAQVSAGTLEQQTQQAQDTQARQDYFQQQGYPLQIAQYLAGIDTAVGSQMGGTGTTEGPTPNTFAQIAGLGLAGASLFAKRGGRISGFAPERRKHRAAGGYSGPWAGSDSWVPNMTPVHGKGPPSAPQPQKSTTGLTADQQKGFGTSLGTLGKAFSNSSWGDSVNDAIQDAGDGEWRGGRIKRYARGGFADGGGPYATAGLGATAPAFDDRFDAVYPHDDTDFNDRFSGNAPGPVDYAGGYDAAPPSSVDRGKSAGFGGDNVIPLPRSRPVEADDSGGEPMDNDVAQAAPAPSSGNPRRDSVIAAAKRNGIDPNVMLRVAQSEGLNESYHGGDGGTSFGAMQLHRGGPGSVGYEFEKQTGLNLADPANEDAANDFAAKWAAKNGWAAWSGARKLGITGKQGVGGDGEEEPDDALAYSGKQPKAAGVAAIDRATSQAGLTPPSQQQAQTEGLLDKMGIHLDPKQRHSLSNALMQAGFAMMATHRGGPGSFLGAAGEAGMAGVGAYSKSQELEHQQDVERERLDMQHTDQQLKVAGAPILPNGQINKSWQAMEKWKSDQLSKDNWAPLPGDGIHPDRMYNKIDGSVKDIPTPTGTASAGQSPASGIGPGQFDYRTTSPQLQKGDTVPEPPAIAGHSPELLKRDAEYYLSAGTLPKASVSARGNAGVQQMIYQRAVQNYAVALAASKGMNMAQMADLQRFGTKAASFPLSRQGDQTVAIGTAIRHLGALEEYAKAWDDSKGNINAPILRQAAAKFATVMGREEPTNLQQAARIAGPEVIKAIGVAGAGTGGERFAQEEGFQPGASTKQILGSANVARTFLAGQLPAKEAQARNVGFPHDRFMDMVGPQEYDYLSAINHKTPGEGGAGGGGGSKPKTVTQNGHTYTLQPDGSYK